ncbi:hypothetical protein L9F63_016478 [Diploptera punctata]|uniref:Uncharacterized protein n=1 Tax=Diploptera punctata TaxID=6984 RepID=A0AAD8A176_DIPPU|nr:hypothetical protein L9F63_016478 [Diploptera punctata]
MSRNHLYRSMPKTVEFLNNMSAIDMAGNNVVGPHTIYNLIPALTGLSFPNELAATCWPKSDVEFDSCPWIFKNFSKAGYRTAYGENMAEWSMFTNGRAGFRVQPTDYYLQPLLSLDENLKINHTKKECFGYRSESQLLIEYVSDFVTTMNSKIFFGFFLDERLTYHEFNIHSDYDDIYFNFLQKHVESGHFNRTILIFLSDHGYRWGDIRKTFQGLHEQRNPFLFFMLPEGFKKKYNIATSNMYNNSQRLITAFDVHETLKDILNSETVLKNNVCLDRSLKIMKSVSLPRGISLFLPIPESRTCSSAGIGDNLCLCQHMESLSINNRVVQSLASLLLKYLSSLLSKYPECSNMELLNVHSAWIHRQNKSILQRQDEKIVDVKGEGDYLVDYTIIISTKPGAAMFEATYRYRPGSWRVLSSFQLVGDVQRINKFYSQGYCINDVMIKPFCYCK